MSAIDKLADLSVKRGMDLRSLAKDAGPPFLQNVIARNGELLTRPGAGLVREYGTTLNCGKTSANVSPFANLGIGRCIGACHVRTAWGADQILAIHVLNAFTGSLKGDNAAPQTDLAGRRGQYITGVVAVVHDLQTGRQTEIVLHQQDTSNADLMNVWPNYATRLDSQDLSRWVTTQREPAWALFAPVARGTARNVVVAIDGLGLWTYRPVSVPAVRSGLFSRQNDSLDRTVLGPNVGEQCMFSPLALADGPLTAAEGFAYVRPVELGTVDAICTFNGDRVIYAVGNTIFFSDPNAPHNVLADNAFVLPTGDTITLVAPVRGLLFVATDRQCWAYSPSLGDVSVAAGTLTAISGGVGCLNNRASVVFSDGVLFADSSGVYAYTGGVKLDWMSEHIDRLWTDSQSLQMVLTDFYTAQGITALATQQLPARIDVREQMKSARLSFDEDRKVLYCVCDDVTLEWTHGFGWSVLYFKTHAGNSLAVAGFGNVLTPTFCQVGADTYIIAGPDITRYTDTVFDPARVANDSSCCLLKLGRGGAIDRSTCIDPATRHVVVLTFGGYIEPGQIATVTIGGGPSTYTVPTTGEVTLETIAQGLAAVLNPLFWYSAVAEGNTVVLVAKTLGTLGQQIITSSMSAGSAGTLTTTTIRNAQDAVVTDGDLEDERVPTGGWVRVFLGGSTAAFWVGQYVKIPAGFRPPGAAVDERVETCWFPVMISGDALVSVFNLHFRFDNLAWEPIAVTAPGAAFGEFRFVVPSERLASSDGNGVGFGYQRGAPNATHQVRVFNAIGNPDPLGFEVRINFDGGGGAWTTTPNLNVGPIGQDPLIWIGFRYRSQLTTSPPTLKTTFWLEPNLGPVIAPTVDGATVMVYFWQQGRYPVEQEALANLQQPVDWAVQTADALGKNGEQLRVRGLLLTAMHLGDGNEDVTPNWRYGPLNTATSTDYRRYSAQALDFNSTPPGLSQQNEIGPFPRIQVTQADDPVSKTCNNVARWGDTAAPADGNLLIDDAAVDELATTDGSQGSRVSVLVHGTLNAPGESVRLGAIRAALKFVGKLQRWR